MNAFVETIRANRGDRRDLPFEELVGNARVRELLDSVEALERMRGSSESLYERVRASLFLYAIHRFRLQVSAELPAAGPLPRDACRSLLERRYEEAIEGLRRASSGRGPDGTVASALAAAYYRAGFETLAEQVRRSVRQSEGNGFLFEVHEPGDHPLRVREELFAPARPCVVERTPVRLDLSHSGWSDIFFLAMDAPEDARVLNISVDLAVRGGGSIGPPVEARVRVLDRPVLRLASVDLGESVDLERTAEVFDFGRDHLGLLRAGVVAAGLVPPSLERRDAPLAALLDTVVSEDRGMEVRTHVRGIPKGSRLAVSTTLLCAIVAAVMRATGQTARLAGPLREDERRLVASRAILGEWLGGSGGGWQDSGGLWPGVKVIEGCLAGPGDPEHGVSRGRLLPAHGLLAGPALHPEFGERLRQSLILVHGGMAQNVGPILEMVTERYLLRFESQTRARRELRRIFDGIVGCVRDGDVRELARLTTRNFEGPLRAILPWVTNAFTETVLARARQRLGVAFHGFLMLGGMSGGGMGFFVDPTERERRRDEIHALLVETKRELESALPFAMDPVVYDFSINETGSLGALEPSASIAERPPARPASLSPGEGLPALLERYGFDPELHEEERRRMRRGAISLARNRLPATTRLEDVSGGELPHAAELGCHAAEGARAIREGRVALVTLAGGLGSRWTGGAGGVKALHPLVEIGGRHRSFLEIQLAKTRPVRSGRRVPIPHVVTTSFLTHDAVVRHLRDLGRDDVTVSPGRSIGLRLIPMTRDLEHAWSETRDERLEERKQRVRDSVRRALRKWARDRGEGADYRDNLPEQCLHPPGHWWEVANLVRGNVLSRLLREQPELDALLLANVDTLGVSLDPALCGWHLATGAALSFEVVPRRFADRGGGLARVDGRVRVVEELAQPRDDDDLALRFYNTMTTWIAIDPLLATFGLDRTDLAGPATRREAAVRRVAERIPTYVTLKEVRRRFGLAQEDVFPVAQLEKLWSDMSALPEIDCRFIVVPRRRGQQLKAPEQLDDWTRDGSLAHVRQIAFVDP